MKQSLISAFKTPFGQLLCCSFLLLTASCNKEVEQASVTKPVDCTGIHWDYDQTSQEGPNKWADLCEGNASCSGVAQSPIDLKNALVDGYLSAIPKNYSVSKTAVTNNGHTLQWTYDSGSSININGTKYNLVQFHFHTPSEHTLNGVRYPLEVHLVHKDTTTGKLAVIGIFFKEGAENPLLKNLLANIPSTVGQTVSSSTTFTAADFFPSSANYYRYNGSLTTPPCSEIVTWTVMSTPIEASSAQIQVFKTLFGANNRPLQAINSRELKFYQG